MPVKQTALLTSADTAKLAADLAATFGHKPLLIFLRGALGAGKTTFAQSFIQQALRANVCVTSPTFSYMNSYDAQNLAIHHFDLYRIEEASEVYALGLAEFLLDEDALRIVEWPEVAMSLLGAPDLDILLTDNGQGRIAQIKIQGQ